MPKQPSQNVEARDFSLVQVQLNVYAELLQMSFPSAVFKCHPEVLSPSAIPECKSPRCMLKLNKAIDGQRFPVELQWCFRGKCFLAMR
jgi:hypothetical protein